MSRRLVLSLALLAGLAAGCNSGGNDELVVYAGRNENLIRPLLEKFAAEEKVDVRVRYGETSDMLATLVEEGDSTRADVFISQDAGALAHLAREERLAPLPDDVLDLVDERFRDPDGLWTGVTGRVRVIAYDTDELQETDLPASVLDLTDPAWKGRVGIAPTNASFIAFVSALGEQLGTDAARQWLEGLAANDVVTYDNNILALEGVENGEVDVALVNHYYLYNEFREEGTDIAVDNFIPGQGEGGEGTFVNISGVAILKGSDELEPAARLARFLLSEEAQEFFRTETSEYPMRAGVDPIAELEPIESLRTIDVPLTALGADYEATVGLIKEAGLS